MASGWTHGNLDTESWDTWPHTGTLWTHRNRWQPRSAVILSVDTDGGQTSEWSCVHQQPRLRWHLVLVITINQQQPALGSVGGRLPPPPSQTEAQTEAGPTTTTQQRGPAEVRTSADLATIYTTPYYHNIYILSYLCLHISMYICILYTV